MAHPCRYCNIQPPTILRSKGASAVQTQSNQIKSGPQQVDRSFPPGPQSLMTCKSFDGFQEDAVLC